MIKRTWLWVVILSILLFPFQAQAGVKSPKRSPKRPPKAVTARRAFTHDMRKGNYTLQRQSEISSLLSRRALLSFDRASQAHLDLSLPLRSHTGMPAARMKSFENTHWQKIYPDKPFLTTSQQVGNYMISHNNRLLVQETARMKQLSVDLTARLPQLEEAIAKSPRPENPLTWLLENIPDQTSMLFLGEVHDVPEIHEAIVTLLAQLREKNPNRKIVLFTEFLPEELHYTANAATATPLGMIQIWKSALRRDIEVIGLEPEFVTGDLSKQQVQNTEGTKLVTLNQWANLEGVRLRNEAWGRTLEKYRAQEPEALFVVYSGLGHCGYNQPFTLSQAFEHEKPYVVSFVPSHKIRTRKIDAEEGNRHVVANYHDMLEQMLVKNLPQPLIHLPDPELSRLAGFDVRLKLEVDKEGLIFDLLMDEMFK